MDVEGFKLVGNDSSEGGVSVEMSGGQFELIDPTACP